MIVIPWPIFIGGDMKLLKEIKELSYQGYGGIQCVCGVQAYKQGERITVLIIELEKNKGTSVTNFMETLMVAIMKIWFPKYSYDDIEWLEHLEATDQYFRVDTEPGTDELRWHDIDKPEWIIDT